MLFSPPVVDMVNLIENLEYQLETKEYLYKKYVQCVQNVNFVGVLIKS